MKLKNQNQLRHLNLYLLLHVDFIFFIYIHIEGKDQYMVLSRRRSSELVYAFCS